MQLTAGLGVGRIIVPPRKRIVRRSSCTPFGWQHERPGNDARFTPSLLGQIHQRGFTHAGFA
ncbi:MAG: hypothetical protein Q4D19_12215, partial [Lautropia sp.]|nr:hypothetical protein [Lautropia sp.]